MSLSLVVTVVHCTGYNNTQWLVVSTMARHVMAHDCLMTDVLQLLVLPNH